MGFHGATPATNPACCPRGSQPPLPARSRGTRRGARRRHPDRRRHRRRLVDDHDDTKLDADGPAPTPSAEGHSAAGRHPRQADRAGHRSRSSKTRSARTAASGTSTRFRPWSRTTSGRARSSSSYRGIEIIGPNSLRRPARDLRRRPAEQALADGRRALRAAGRGEQRLDHVRPDQAPPPRRRAPIRRSIASLDRFALSTAMLKTSPTPAKAARDRRHADLRRRSAPPGLPRSCSSPGSTRPRSRPRSTAVLQ